VIMAIHCYWSTRGYLWAGWFWQALYETNFDDIDTSVIYGCYGMDTPGMVSTMKA
jgi:hypothetical protein